MYLIATCMSMQITCQHRCHQVVFEKGKFCMSTCKNVHVNIGPLFPDEIFVVGMLASAAPNNIIPEFRSRSDAKFNGYAWIRYSECRPSATPSAALDVRTGRYSMLILPSGTQQNGMMREADVEALRHFWDDVMRYAQLATPAIAPASSARSPPPNVQFQRGSLMPPPEDSCRG